MFEAVTNAAEVTPLGWAIVIGGGLGLASAAHCAGMCGGFPLMMVSGDQSKKGKLFRLFGYNFGRGLTYVILGTLAALIGSAMGRTADSFVNDGSLIWVGRALTVLLGLVLFFSGLFMLGVRLPMFREGHQGFMGELVAKTGRGLFRSKSPFTSLSVGAINGLLPCPLVYAMLFSAFHLGTIVNWQSGAAASVGFAIGTMPIMFAIGLIGGAVTIGFRKKFAKVAGVGLILLALVTIARGVMLDQMHEFLPGNHVHASHVGAGDITFDQVSGERILIPEGMSDAEWEALMEEEIALKEDLEAAVNSGVEALRAYDARLSRRDHLRQVHELHAFTLLPANLEALRAKYPEDKVFTYRCSCCGTPREATLKLFNPYDVLLFPEGETPED